MPETVDAYRKLFEYSPDAILIIEGDRFVDCNPAALRMMRFPSKEALLQRYSGGTEEGTLRAHPAEFSPPTQSDGRDSYEKAEEFLALTFERGSHVFEWDHLTADGDVFTVEVMLTVVERGPKPILHVVWRDIAERKRIEEQLRQAQRLEAVGRLAGGIAHDFNNLLVVILSHADLLIDELKQAGLPEQAARVREMESAGDRAAALTRQLLTFSKGKPIKPRATDLVGLLDSLGALLARLIGEHIAFELDLPETAVNVLADRSQIEQLVVNLAVNARDAMPEGGRLVVSLSERDHMPAGALRHLPEGAYAVIRVADTGEGMHPDQIARAFDPFFTTKDAGAGTGLGLATVLSVAEQSGGTAWIESRPGEGTAVEVLIPITATAPSPHVPQPIAVGSLDGHETVLVAEDESTIRELMRRILESRGYSVLLAADGIEAVRLAREADHPIHLLVTDVVMPRLSGIHVATQVRAIQPGVRTLFISGYAREGSFASLPADDDAEILEKPFSPTALLCAMRRVLDAR
ncbi:MAG: ATP-binding protein [Planctomycetota bacterium]|nr:ATP-binding protein [Planctomycetota bacterium]